MYFETSEFARNGFDKYSLRAQRASESVSDCRVIVPCKLPVVTTHCTDNASNRTDHILMLPRVRYKTHLAKSNCANNIADRRLHLIHQLIWAYPKRCRMLLPV